jgi:hypothetical protein
MKRHLIAIAATLLLSNCALFKGTTPAVACDDKTMADAVMRFAAALRVIIAREDPSWANAAIRLIEPQLQLALCALPQLLGEAQREFDGWNTVQSFTPSVEPKNEKARTAAATQLARTEALWALYRDRK